MDEDLATLEGALAFINRIRAEAKTLGTIRLNPFQFVRAIELGAITYESDGINVGHFNVGSCTPKISGASIILE